MENMKAFVGLKNGNKLIVFTHDHNNIINRYHVTHVKEINISDETLWYAIIWSESDGIELITGNEPDSLLRAVLNSGKIDELMKPGHVTDVDPLGATNANVREFLATLYNTHDADCEFLEDENGNSLAMKKYLTSLMARHIKRAIEEFPDKEYFVPFKTTSPLMDMDYESATIYHYGDDDNNGANVLAWSKKEADEEGIDKPSGNRLMGKDTFESLDQLKEEGKAQPCFGYDEETEHKQTFAKVLINPCSYCSEC